MPTHSETRHVPYSAEEMYALVADVANYPEFLPWTAAARIRDVIEEGDREIMLADLVITFKVFREKFGSRVTLWPEERRIDTEYLDGPFKHMESTWRFKDAEGGGSTIDFHVDFEFRSRILQTTATFFFNDAMQRVVRAFERRADVLYG
ncbi:MAG: type II toxin-antitoxin system RatA family toxin [Silicimonas sp.]|nr:type II toxin-antitoxin system RatA family toxin [Silicimonas sp.]